MNKLIAVLITFLFVAGCSGNSPGADSIGSGGTNGATNNGTTNSAQGNDGQPGQTGATGSQGPVGEKGDKGDPGANNQIVKTWNCDFKKPSAQLKKADNTSCDLQSFDFWYYAAETNSGDTFVRAGVDIFNPGHTVALGSNNSSEFWKAGTWEATHAANWVLLDVAGCGSSFTGNWAFDLDKNANHLTVSYTDSDVLGGQVSFDTYCKN